MGSPGIGYEIVLPRLNVNDHVYTVSDWLFVDGDDVPAGAAVVVVETSKAIEELTSETGGVLRREVLEGAEVESGTVLGRLFASNDEWLRATEAGDVGGPGGDGAAPQPAEQPDDVLITEPARRLAEQHGVALERLRALGAPVVLTGHVEQLLAAMTSTAEAEGPEERIEIDRVQRGVAAVVTLSHREIPAASLVMKVPVDGALGRARLLMTETRQIVGLPELLIGAIAAAREPFPLAFAERIDDRTARVRPGAHVAVTVDLGNGLYLPVLRDAQAATTQQIAEWLAGARQQASKAAFRAEELTGANIMLSLHTEPDVVFATPLIFPGHACVVSLGGVQEEARAVRGEILSARFVHLGLAYDHRIINGRLAIAFCRRLKETLEKPG